MPEKKITRLDWWPEWFTGKTINEPIFCREFLEKHRLAYSENCFFSPNGKVTDENNLRSAIYHLLEPFVNNIELFMESQGYITRGKDLTVSSRQLAQIYVTWCDENTYPAMKSKTLIEYLTANQEKFGIVYTNNIVNAAGRRVRGFKGIGPAIRMPGTDRIRFSTMMGRMAGSVMFQAFCQRFAPSMVAAS